MPVITRYLKGGGIRKIAEPGDHARYGVAPRRASRVEPAALGRRLVFLALRKAFGDGGRVAAWTRTWRGPWRARMFIRPRPVLGPFPTRQEALVAEAQWLIENWVLTPCPDIP